MPTHTARRGAAPPCLQRAQAQGRRLWRLHLPRDAGVPGGAAPAAHAGAPPMRAVTPPRHTHTPQPPPHPPHPLPPTPLPHTHASFPSGGRGPLLLRLLPCARCPRWAGDGRLRPLRAHPRAPCRWSSGCGLTSRSTTCRTRLTSAPSCLVRAVGAPVGAARARACRQGRPAPGLRPSAVPAA